MVRIKVARIVIINSDKYSEHLPDDLGNPIVCTWSVGKKVKYKFNSSKSFVEIKAKNFSNHFRSVS